jgi:hypothetical protein
MSSVKLIQMYKMKIIPGLKKIEKASDPEGKKSIPIK